MLNVAEHTLRKLEALSEDNCCDRRRIADLIADIEARQESAEERLAIEIAESEALENAYVWHEALLVPFAAEYPETPYRAFCRVRDKQISKISARMREGGETPHLCAAWLVLVYGTEEQADIVMTQRDKRDVLLASIISAGGMKSERNTWVDLP